MLEPAKADAEKARDEAASAAASQKTKVARASIKSAKKKAKSKKIRITWKKVKQADGYELQYATNAKFKNTAIFYRGWNSADEQK